MMSAMTPIISSLCVGPTNILYITGSEIRVGLTSTSVPILLDTSLATASEMLSFLNAPI